MTSLWLLIPFGGLLLSVALVPVWAPDFWHRRMPVVVGLWVLSLFGLWLQTTPLFEIFLAVIHTLAHEYIPFFVLMTTLYVISGGIWIDIQAPSHPLINVSLLAMGTCLAGWIGTMGASMILIRPFLSLNRDRIHRTHLFVFFIFLVSNVGGALTPLGDPPLFMGFLKGVHFFWPLQHLFHPWFFTTCVLMLMFLCLEIWFWHKETHQTPHLRTLKNSSFHIRGIRNFFFLAASVATAMMGGVLQDIRWSLGPLVFWGFEGFRELLLGFWAFLAWYVTAPSIREHNHFTWEPIREVGILFLGIFITLIPITDFLHHHGLGSFQSLIQNAQGIWDPHAFFWLSGLLSAFLDNAPTYLLFFHLAGGDPQVLMTQDALVLKAFSLGSVFMGALTYIGNAPNLMVRSIATRRHMHVPSFLGYLGYSVVILVPVLYTVSKLFLQ